LREWTPEAQAIVTLFFGRLCAEGPLCTMQKALESVVARSHPGYVPLYSPAAFTDRMGDQRRGIVAAFQLTGFCLDFKYFTDPADERLRAARDWTAGLWRHILPPQEGAEFLGSLSAAWQRDIARYGARSARLELIDRPFFAEAVRCGFVTPAADPIAALCFGGVFIQRAAEEFVESLLGGAIPYSGPGGKILVLPLQDPRSERLFAAAREATAIAHGINLHHAVRAALYSPKKWKQLSKQAYALLGLLLNWTAKETAERFLSAGLIAHEQETGEAALKNPDTLESAERQAKRFRAQVKALDPDLPG
jgi:hypothetical protein